MKLSKKILSEFNDPVVNLEMLAEEAAEVIRIKSKIFRFGWIDDRKKNNANNKQALEEEIGHFMAMVLILIETGTISESNIEMGVLNKFHNLDTWYQKLHLEELDRI